jgi:hypothetical protein
LETEGTRIESSIEGVGEIKLVRVYNWRDGQRKEVVEAKGFSDWAEEEVVLVVQDTTSLNYSLHPATENLGSIGSKGSEVIGLMVHDTMVFNLEWTPLGLVNVECWGGT